MPKQNRKWRASEICESIEHYQVKLRDEDKLRTFGQKESTNISFQYALIGCSLCILFPVLIWLSINLITNLHANTDNRHSYPAPVLDSFPISP